MLVANGILNRTTIFHSPLVVVFCWGVGRGAPLKQGRPKCPWFSGDSNIMGRRFVCSTLFGGRSKASRNPRSPKGPPSQALAFPPNRPLLLAPEGGHVLPHEGGGRQLPLHAGILGLKLPQTCLASDRADWPEHF